MMDPIPETQSLILAKEQLLEKVKTMNLFHDVFAAAVFKNKGACLHLIRVLMQNPTLKILQYRTQNDIPQLISHGVRLDVLAEDTKGRIYEIEVQNQEEPSPAHRMRFYTSVMDSEFLLKGAAYDKLPEVHLFYLSQKDIWEQGKMIYEVRQSLCSDDFSIPYDNGLHTAFVNAAINDGSDIAKLMQYLKTANAGDTSQGALSAYVNKLKSPKGGKIIMGEFEKHFLNEGVKKGNQQGMRRFAELTKKLLSLGRTEDLNRAAEDDNYRDKLFKEFTIQ